MKKSLSTLPTLFLTVLLAAAAPALHAADDNERGTSVYDKNPECMDRTQANNPKCVIDNGPSRPKVVGATQGKGGTTTPGTGTGTGGTGTQGSGKSTGKAAMSH